MNAMRSWPRSTRSWRGHAAALLVVGRDGRDARPARVDEDDRHAGRREPVELHGAGREREDEEAVGPVAPGQRGEVLVAVHRRLDVEQDEVVATVVERGDHAPKPLDGRRVGEERDDHPEGLAAAPREPLGHGVGAVGELLDGGEDPLTGRRAHPRAAVQHPGHRSGTDRRSSSNVADRDHGGPQRGTASTLCDEPKPTRSGSQSNPARGAGRACDHLVPPESR